MAVEDSAAEAINSGRDLRALAKLGLLEARGETRGRYYLASDVLLQNAPRLLL